MKRKEKQTLKQTNTFLKYTSLSFEMMAIIAGFTFLGYKIDGWMNNDFKGFTLFFVIFSVIASIIYGTRSLLKKTDNKK